MRDEALSFIRTKTTTGEVRGGTRVRGQPEIFPVSFCGSAAGRSREREEAVGGLAQRNNNSSEIIIKNK